MDELSVKDFDEFLKDISNLKTDPKELVLYRGQNFNHKLLPAIARSNCEIDTTKMEKEMLDELKRRFPQLLNTSNVTDDWDLVAYAQHFGLKTRLLDWTTNPLVALWFACQNHTKPSNSINLYVLDDAANLQLDREKVKNPFNIKTTKVFKPNLNNERIIAQAGWFTAHPYSKSSGRFVNIATNRALKGAVTCFKINGKEKDAILLKLDVFGINHQSLFPDVSGVCNQINWEFFYGNQ